jgi:PAS domain-containing protein
LTPQSLRILLIADDPELIRRIGEGLQRQDSGLILIEGADSLATARRRLGAGSYDLALADLALGEGDGLRLISELVQIAPELPVVALSGDGAGPDAAACLAVGAQDRLAPEAMDAAGLVDRLRSATARAEAERRARRRSQRLAGSLGATGDLAWHWEQGAAEVWLTAGDPAAWQLPAKECRESLDALRERIHPDDREKAVRRIEELVTTALPWQVDARVRVGGGAYRWCELRGRSRLDERGGLLAAAGVVADAQRQQRTLREVEQGRRFLRAIFDSDRAPRAVLNSAGIVTDCNQAWLALSAPAIHAGKRFGPGVSFIDDPPEDAGFGDLSTVEMARGVRQVLGGVTEHFGCEYGDGERRWRLRVGPLLNPGIAGAIVIHEEITENARGEIESRAELAEASADLQAIGEPLFRVDADFRVLAANPAAHALGRAPVEGRDVLRVLPRLHADAVGAALAELTAGAESVTRDTRDKGGSVTRWRVTQRRDAAGKPAGFLARGVDVSDLAQAASAATGAANAAEIESLRAALAGAEQERDKLRTELTEAFEGLEEARRARLASEREQPALRDELEKARQRLDQARREAEEARRGQAAVEEQGRRLLAELEAERRRLQEAVEALAGLRAEVLEARQNLRSEVGDLLDREFKRMLGPPGGEPAAARAKDKAKAG